MADSTKFNYFSEWDMDQQTGSNSMVVPMGTTRITTLDANQPAVSQVEVQLRETGLTGWYQPGYHSRTGTLAGGEIFSYYVQGRDVYVTTTVAGTVRWFIYADKVDY